MILPTRETLILRAILKSLRRAAAVAMLALLTSTAAQATVFHSSTTFNGNNNNLDRGNGIAVDSAGNVYAIGTAWSDGGLKLWVGKYDSSLVLVSSTIITAINFGSLGQGIKIDSSDNIY